MKMPEKHDLLAAILAAKEQGTQQLAFAMAYLRGRYNGGAFTKQQSTQRCAIIALVHFRDLRLRRTK